MTSEYLYYSLLDINECEYDDICQDGYCSNTGGSYTCVCGEGYYYSEIIEDCICKFIIK